MLAEKIWKTKTSAHTTARPQESGGGTMKDKELIANAWGDICCPNCRKIVQIERYPWCEGEWDEDDQHMELSQKVKHLQTCCHSIFTIILFSSPNHLWRELIQAEEE